MDERSLIAHKYTTHTMWRQIVEDSKALHIVYKINMKFYY